MSASLVNNVNTDLSLVNIFITRLSLVICVQVTQPRDRQRLLAALAGLQTVLGDGLPDHVPDSLQQWLGLIRLDSYYPSLVTQVRIKTPS